MEVDLDAPAGTVEHHLPGGEVNRLTAQHAEHDLTAAVCFSVHEPGGVRVRVRRQAPVGSGLGGSSTYGVALAAALARLSDQRHGDGDLVALVRDLEARILGVPTGTQDHWAAARGGVLALHLRAGGNRVEALAVEPAWLSQRLSVVFTGITHHSGMVNWQVIRRRIEQDAATTNAFARIAAAARACRQALIDHDESGVADAIRSEWSARKLLAPEVCPEELAALEQTALGAGALAVKACGAGGGGSLLLWHRPEERQAVIHSLLDAAPAAELLAAGVTAAGCSVELLPG
jgi:D-glycero-alpha-D-manno-heptose-7-phosphate kinase